MHEQSIDADEIADLLAKLDGLDLTGNQRALLRAILRAAGDISENGHPHKRSFAAEFGDAFTPHQAGVVLSYAAAPLYPNKESGRDTPPGAAVPAMITGDK